MVQAVLDVVCGPQEAQHVLVWATGERNLIFYANDGRILGRSHKWLQDALMFTVALFCRMGMETNLEKSKAMVCMPALIWGNWGEKYYKWRAIGGGSTFRERKRMQVSCTECGMTVASSYLKQHVEILHIICVPYTSGVNEGGGGLPLMWFHSLGYCSW